MSDTATIAALTVAIETGTPTVLVGLPGVGKTSGTYAIGEALDRHLEVVISSLRDQTDFGGLPIVLADGTTKLAAAAWAHRLAAAPRGLLFLDEVNTCTPNVQAAVLRVVLERVVGEFYMGKHVSVVAAMNPPEASAGGNELTAPLSNRMLHLPWTITPERFIEGLLAGWTAPNVRRIPEDWESYVPKYAALIAGFLNVKRTLVLACPTDETKQGQPWPSPRSWTMLTRLLGASEAMGYGEDVRSLLAVGSVGTGAGAEFLAWAKALDLPDPEECLANPGKVVIPDRGDKCFTMLVSIANAAVNKLTKPRYLAAWEIFYNAAKAGKADVAAVSVKTLAKVARPGAKQEAPKWLTDSEVRNAMTEYVKPFRAILQQAGILGQA